MTRRRLYWTCQLVGWAAAAAVWFGLSALTGGIETSGATPAQLATAIAVGYAFCVGGSHGVHVVATRLGWRTLRLRALAGRLLVASLGAAAATQAAGHALFAAAEPWLNPAAVGPQPPPDPVAFLGTVLMATAVFAAWSTVYALGLVAFRLSDAERERVELRASLAEARARALEYQLNPHFLFNALNTVRALIAEEPLEARRAVTLLSGLLRQTLAAGREATHPLSAELALVRTYLDLEQLRFDDRLAVRLDVADAAAAVAVPTLLVQTLVENAVKHGVARRRAGGEVVVAAEIHVAEPDAAEVHAAEPDAAAPGRHRLALRVENPSPGPTAAPLSDGTGTGLANARERLALLFGADAHLDLDVGPRTTVATVTLPAHPGA